MIELIPPYPFSISLSLLHGDGTKFHKTLTVAAVKVVHHFKQKSLTQSFQSFIQENPGLKNSFKALLDQHYHPKTYLSAAARKFYLPPDRMAFS